MVARVTPTEGGTRGTNVLTYLKYPGHQPGPLTISSNIIHAGFGDNPTSGSYGIFVGSTHDAPVTIYDNTVVGDVPGLSAAIGLTQVSKPIVLTNRLSGAFVGISMQHVTGAMISSNNIVNSTTGISTGRPGTGNLIVGNSMNDASCGIYAPAAGANLFFNVTIVNCYASGLPNL